VIGASLEAAPIGFVADDCAAWQALESCLAFEDVCITSAILRSPGDWTLRREGISGMPETDGRLLSCRESGLGEKWHAAGRSMPDVWHTRSRGLCARCDEGRVLNDGCAALSGVFG